MKVLFLANIPSPYRVDFFNELGKQCELTVLFEKKKADDREWNTSNYTHFNCIFLNGIKVSADTALCFEVIKYLKLSYDFIVIGGYSTPTGMLAIEYLKFKKKKFILSADGGLIKNEKKINYLIKRHFIGSASWWLSTGKMTTNYLKYYGASKERIYLYPFSSIRNEQFDQTEITGEKKNILKEQLNIKGDKVIISVGQFIHRKGFDVLLKAVNDLPDNIDLYIIGGQPTDEYIKIVEESKFKNIYFKNFMQPKELYSFYAISDLFVLPTREDIWGLVINEALSCGLPVITTDKCIAGVELVKKGINGVIVPVNDINKLNESIKHVLNLSLDKQQIKESVKKYTIEEMANSHLNIFNKLLKEGD